MISYSDVMRCTIERVHYDITIESVGIVTTEDNGDNDVTMFPYVLDTG